MLGRILDTFFPPACVGCGRGAWPFCHTCWRHIALLIPPGCRSCGRPLEHSVDRCSDCPPPPVTWSRAAFLYEGPVRTALMRLKFAGLRTTAAAFAPWMVWALARSPPTDSDPETPAITWVPLAAGRRRARGYDQAEALARAVARTMGVSARRLLDRVVETPPQARRSGPARRQALRGAFMATGLVAPRVLLIDDVLTSGATVASCALALRRAGAREVGVLAAARSLGSPVPARCYNPPMSQPGSVVARERSSR